MAAANMDSGGGGLVLGLGNGGKHCIRRIYVDKIKAIKL